jgi:hypothetical protein
MWDRCRNRHQMGWEWVMVFLLLAQELWIFTCFTFHFVSFTTLFQRKFDRRLFKFTFTNILHNSCLFSSDLNTFHAFDILTINFHHWIHRWSFLLLFAGLYKVMLKSHTHIGCNVSEIQNQKDEHQAFQDTAKVRCIKHISLNLSIIFIISLLFCCRAHSITAFNY